MQDVPWFTLIRGAEVYAPHSLGREDILFVGEHIASIGTVDTNALRALHLDCDVVDATGCMALPGFIDGHAHLIGAGGEQGFASRTREVDLEDLVVAGVTTAIGCPGTDTLTRPLMTLLAKVRQLVAGGLSAFMLTGGFPVPPPTLLGSVERDLVVVPEIIGVGEIAVADQRALEPTPRELAHVATDALRAGTLAEKAGATLIHVGEGRERLQAVRAALEQSELSPDRLHVLHVNRSQALMDDAITVAQRGAHVSIDTVDENLAEWVAYYLEHGGPPDQLTICSDAHTCGGSLRKLYDQFLACVRSGLLMDDMLPMFTVNPASAWQLRTKCGLGPGMDADMLLVDRASMQLSHVFARGRQLLRDGQVLA